LDVGLVELSKAEYVSAIGMLTKKDIYGNWTKRHMCEDYAMNKHTHSDKYAMPLPKEIFDALG
jgi:hypothetical protein